MVWCANFWGGMDGSDRTCLHMYCFFILCTCLHARDTHEWFTGGEGHGAGAGGRADSARRPRHRLHAAVRKRTTGSQTRVSTMHIYVQTAQEGPFIRPTTKPPICMYAYTRHTTQQPGPAPRDPRRVALRRRQDRGQGCVCVVHACQYSTCVYDSSGTESPSQTPTP